MVVIAVAGGSSGLGRTIVEAIQSQEKHEVKILTRKVNNTLEKEIGAPMIAVDYSSVAALTQSLERHNVHTLISTIYMAMDGAEFLEPNLIQAADSSQTTQRMIANGWGFPMTSKHAFLPIAKNKIDMKSWLSSTSNLEYTIIHVGFFLDYWCQPGVKSYMPPTVMVIDMESNRAALPGSGDTPVALTHTRDVAKFVAALLDLSRWEPEVSLVGNKITWREVLELAENAKGACRRAEADTKFDVTYDSVEMMQAGRVTELPSQVAFYPFVPKETLQYYNSVFSLWFEDGSYDIPLLGSSIAGELLRDVKPLTAKEALEQAWKKN